MKSRGWGVPLVLGVITAVLLALSLWTPQPAMRSVVVASRDLGAGTQLTAADLTLYSLPEAEAPADALSDPQALFGETLSVVRFAGEGITLRHLGEAVALAADERGIAVKVTTDTGLAGLLRPGMTVGVVATLPDDENRMYAKAMLDGVRVLYVPPEFQARPYTPVSAQMSVSGGESNGTVVNAPPPAALDEGVIVLAASTQPFTVTYQLPTSDPTLALPAIERVVTPLELLAALNAADASFTLVLSPDAATPFTTEGLTLETMRMESEVQP